MWANVQMRSNISGLSLSENVRFIYQDVQPPYLNFHCFSPIFLSHQLPTTYYPPHPLINISSLRCHEVSDLCSSKSVMTKVIFTFLKPNILEAPVKVMVVVKIPASIESDAQHQPQHLLIFATTQVSHKHQQSLNQNYYQPIFHKTVPGGLFSCPVLAPRVLSPSNFSLLKGW